MEQARRSERAHRSDSREAVAARAHSSAPIPADTLPPREWGGQPGDISPDSFEAECAAHAFLCRDLVDRATLERAVRLAQGSGATTAAALVALGWVDERAYVAALARHTGLPIASAADIDGGRLRPDTQPRTVRLRNGPAWRSGATALLAVAWPAGTIVDRLRRDPAVRSVTALVAGADLDLAVSAAHRPALMRRAVSDFAVLEPELSARGGATSAQLIALAVLLGLTCGAGLVLPHVVSSWIAGILTLSFLCVVLLRLAAIRALLGQGSRNALPTRAALPDSALPFYTVMVALYREEEVLPRLVAGLSALDYPSTRLEVLLVLEESDAATRRAAAALAMPGMFRVVVVPKGGPQTKPKALNFALQLARGDIVVVYDAEDRPEPGQLRAAAAALAAGDPSIACVQASLNIYNPDECFLTRQFAIEYSVLFDGLLPALDRLDWPLPLGGTSNHFPLATLKALGAWDPYNVTEDADLGVRLARRGLRTVTIASTTWEEAPHRFADWLPQRTRWLKGWMQTAITHTRHPVRLWRDLGTWRLFGLLVVMAGMLASVLAFPISLGLVAAAWWHGTLLAAPESSWLQWLWWVAVANLVLGFSTTMLAGAIAALRRGRLGLAPRALAMPWYWLLVSMAGYRALWQLVHRPFHWEKTRHGVRRRAG